MLECVMIILSGIATEIPRNKSCKLNLIGLNLYPSPFNIFTYTCHVYHEELHDACSIPKASIKIYVYFPCRIKWQSGSNAVPLSHSNTYIIIDMCFQRPDMFLQDVPPVTFRCIRFPFAIPRGSKVCINVSL